MGPGLRKFTLTVHLVVSVGWIGAVVAYIALGLSATHSQDTQTIRAAWIAMDLTGWYAIVPLAITALLSGVVMSLGTPWGLFRHYWVLISFVLTTFSTLILLLHMPSVTSIAAMLRKADDASATSHSGDLFHAGVGLIVLIAVMVLNVYKPRGLTPYGWRKQNEDLRPRAGTGVPARSTP